ncbi:bifunctional 4-hydroxy-2-oxoglutarate aldolase/2-dehydro-3-deoxy-phosphogluconate aldolase [Pleionea sediminis]|uniref:bifunctional 4-hydroxy-2-oxoglutarate aldolase/2-dehydro-3-deoxy-phosphogluconate aldolase n=1 Tax=Pleionea sediminis TaxID=2569479 RepID=UPI001186FE4E|nr:bifunctional 4-hydroxy-2-oxoglutarate aldolase/2-dehydro-3-deoxy-phosphogluconate aldolase [Pleionea sediminis]
MNKHLTIHSILKTVPVIPVLEIDDIDKAVPLAQALIAGGLTIMEITLRTDVAFAAMEQIQEHVPEAVVGAGTVVSESQLKQLEQMQVSFAASPGITKALLASSADCSIALLPGVSSASEIMLGMEYGFNCFKFFPAEPLGGTKSLKAFSGPFRSVTFCPTGGVSSHNFHEYLALPNVVCVGGSWVAPKALIAANDWEGISKLAKSTRVF